MLIGADETLQLCTRLLAGSLTVQTVEMLSIRGCLSEAGIWRMGTLRPELMRLPAVLRVVCLAVFPYDRFMWLLALQLALSAALLLAGPSALLFLVALTTLLISMRFRGTFNGGSDAMTLLSTLCLALAACPVAQPTLQRVSLGYLALQTCLSYFVAGLIKLKEVSWRKGSALRQFAELPRYGVPTPALGALRRAPVSRWLGYAVIALECSFPLALLSPGWCLGYLSVALLFHLANAALFGLNRFLLAWLATYPAVFHVSQLGPLAGL